MWSKFFRIPVLLLFLVIAYYGCVEEPTIDPVKRPYTLLRVANFSYNVDTLIVSIDSGKTVLTLYKNQLPTQYFEITSGKRHFLVKNSTGTILYNDKITMSSYEEISLLFTGFSKPGDDSLNSFGTSVFSNGLVYLYESIGQNSALVYNGILNPDTPNDTATYLKYGVLITDTATSNIALDNTLSFNSFGGVSLPGNTTYKISISGITASNVTAQLSDTLFTFESGSGYFVYVVGPSNKPFFIMEKFSPLLIRSK